jgi:hypothetical protein
MYFWHAENLHGYFALGIDTTHVRIDAATSSTGSRAIILVTTAGAAATTVGLANWIARLSLPK